MGYRKKISFTQVIILFFSEERQEYFCELQGLLFFLNELIFNSYTIAELIYNQNKLLLFSKKTTDTAAVVQLLSQYQVQILSQLSTSYNNKFTAGLLQFTAKIDRAVQSALNLHNDYFKRKLILDAFAA